VKLESVAYPGWQQYAPKGLSIAALEAQIVSSVPEGPIPIVGYMIGELI
jgi:hypothetical protein